MKTRLFNSQRFSALIHSATSTFILSIALTLGTATQALAQETASPKSKLTKERNRKIRLKVTREEAAFRRRWV